MSKTSVINTMPQQDKDYEVAVDRYLIEIEHIRSDMSESQKRIERLRIETSDILAETRQVLSKLTS
jgi:hypothetical protein